jgi:hypothetical protein
MTGNSILLDFSAKLSHVFFLQGRLFSPCPVLELIFGLAIKVIETAFNLTPPSRA